ncbi:MAG: magnesium transporter [Armatimonadetes bacterium 55-13]|nr:magnesium transporter [Armatimonadota bacterium]OJU65136.1 MAG: magnesium transporter [Armatimonadetes bacterium 55-13]
MRSDDQTFIEQLESLSRSQNGALIREQLSDERPEDLADALVRLDLDEGLVVLKSLDAEQAGYILVELPTETARAYIRELPDTTLAHYLDILPMDDALDLREELGPERFDALLEIIPAEDALEIRRLMEYPEDAVGRIMTEQFFEVSPDTTMAEVLKDIRLSSEEKYETVNDIYVLDQHSHLLGVFSLRRAIRALPDQKAGELMNQEPVTCEAFELAEEAARRMARYGFYALPVLDRRGRMVGLFTGDDAQTVIREEDTEDVLKMGAVSGDAEAYLSLSVWQLVKRRVPWLLGLFVAESLTGNVLRYYGQGGDDLHMNPLAFFIPLLIGAGGNSGSQVTTTITRALALGEVRPTDWWRVTRREIATALISGTILGVVGFLRAFVNVPILGWGAPLDLSLVVGAALPAIIIWSTSVGSLLPITAKRFGLDPAVMSAPFISTFVDATGLIIYFEIAKHVLGHLGT